MAILSNKNNFFISIYVLKFVHRNARKKLSTAHIHHTYKQPDKIIFAEGGGGGAVSYNSIWSIVPVEYLIIIPIKEKWWQKEWDRS